MNAELIDALRLGEVGCLIALALEPISDNHKKWQEAAALIRKQREKLEQQKEEAA